MSTLRLEYKYNVARGIWGHEWTTLPSMNCRTLFRLKDCKWDLVSPMGPLSHEMMRFLIIHKWSGPCMSFFICSSSQWLLALVWYLLGHENSTYFLSCKSEFSLGDSQDIQSGSSAELTKLYKDHWPGHCGWRQQNTAIKCNCTLC